METKANSLRTWGLSVIVLAVIAAGFVAYGVITHKEGGFLKVCWEDNNAIYTEDLQGNGSEQNKQCKAPVPLIWPKKQLPLSIVVFGPDNNPIKKNGSGPKVVQAAISDFNLQIGKTIFEMAKITDEEPDVAVIWNIPSIVGSTGSDSRKIGGYVTHSKIGSSMQAIVRIREISSDRLAFITTLHELGHVAGLEHDDFLSSLMYPRMMTDELNTATTRITDSDVRLIVSTYGL
jgi:hypothetical protein